MECYEIGSVVRSARIRHGMTPGGSGFWHLCSEYIVED